MCPDPDTLGKLRKMSKCPLADGELDQNMRYVCRAFDIRSRQLFSSASPLDPQLQAWEFIPGNACQQVLACGWFQGKEGRLYCFMILGVHVWTRSALIGCPRFWVLLLCRPNGWS